MSTTAPIQVAQANILLRGGSKALQATIHNHVKIFPSLVLRSETLM